MRTFVIAAIAFGSFLSVAPVAAQEPLLVDEEVYSISQCGTGLLQTTCVVLNLRYRTVCTGLEFCRPGTIRFDQVHTELIGASDLPLGGNAGYEIRYVDFPSCQPPFCEEGVGVYTSGACSWPLLAGSCQAEGDFTDPPFFGRLLVRVNASSLLSATAAEERFDATFDSQGQISFVP